MRFLVGKVTMALALAYGCWVAAGCGDERNGGTDGGAGAGGAGGSGGSGAMDASDGPKGTVGCLPKPIPEVTCPTPPVKYDNIKAIIQAQCVNACHNGITPDPANNNLPHWPLSEQKHLTDWQDTIRATIAECVMPPPDAGIPVTIEERRLILEYIKCEYGK